MKVSIKVDASAYDNQHNLCRSCRVEVVGEKTPGMSENEAYDETFANALKLVKEALGCERTEK